MLIRRKPSWHIAENEVTPEAAYLSRRQIMGGAAGVGAASLVAGCDNLLGLDPVDVDLDRPSIADAPRTISMDADLTPEETVISYNNFYEFGTGKSDPARYAHAMTTEPWSVQVDGLCDNPGTFAVEDLVDFNALEERVYRLRCVEAWSMVIPWIGVPLSTVLARCEPQSGARYVAFETYANREEMRGLRSRVLDWPYVEGLRMDEAMHPLTLMVVGLYGKVVPNQNGAPLRLIVPWKYGFKSIKSIVRISFVADQPPTAWNMSQPREYGFYSNVNPTVSHPRWRQDSERVIGGAPGERRDTDMFNGYAEEVASLYAGMDLRRNF